MCAWWNSVAAKPIAIAFALCAMALWCDYAQGQNHQWQLMPTVGYMMPNNFNMPEYNRTTVGIEAQWWHNTQGTALWQRLRGLPQFGVKGSFAYVFNGPAGHRFGIAGAVKAPLWRCVDYHLALGFSVYTRPYSLTHDAENIFIGSLVSCLIDIGFDVNVGQSVVLNASFLHTSNGNLYRPNKGLNFLQGGVGFKLGDKRKPTIPGTALQPTDADPYTYRPHGNQVSATLSGGVVMSRHLMQQGYYPCYDVSVAWLHYVSPVVAVGGAADVWYNHSHTWQLPRYADRYALPMYLGVQGVVEGHWGPLSIRGGVGVVALASTRVGMRIYERVGAYYNWGRNYAGVGLNARGGMIEFVEFGYGLRFAVGQ